MASCGALFLSFSGPTSSDTSSSTWFDNGLNYAELVETASVSALATDDITGSGTEADPYIVYTGAGLAYFAYYTSNVGALSDCYIELGANIDLDGYMWVPIGNATYTFSGSLEGNNYTISNLVSDGTTLTGLTSYITSSYYGLFGYTGAISVSNLTLSTFEIEATQYIGNLVGYSYSSDGKITLSNITVVDCYLSQARNSTAAAYAGCVVGRIDNPAITITGIEVSSSHVTAYSYAGGIVGYIYSTLSSLTETIKISSCTLEDFDFVYDNASGGYYGGIVGYLRGNLDSSTLDIEISDCNVTNLTGLYSSSGGIVGYLYGNLDSSTLDIEISDCSVTNAEGLGSSVGGIIGYLYDYNAASTENITISNCEVMNLYWSTVSTQRGGILGFMYHGGSSSKTTTVTISNCNVTRLGTLGETGGGIVGYINLGIAGLNVTISYCNALETVFSSTSNASGGIIGYIYNTAKTNNIGNFSIKYCSTSNAEGETDQCNGGIVGSAFGYNSSYNIASLKIENCVNNHYALGGILGHGYYIIGTYIYDCLNMADCSAAFIYQTVGGVYYSYLYNCINTAANTYMFYTPVYICAINCFSISTYAMSYNTGSLYLYHCFNNYDESATSGNPYYASSTSLPSAYSTSGAVKDLDQLMLTEEAYDMTYRFTYYQEYAESDATEYTDGYWSYPWFIGYVWIFKDGENDGYPMPKLGDDVDTWIDEGVYAEPTSAVLSSMLEGEGTSSSPYLISSALDLAALSYYTANVGAISSGTYFLVTEDIDLTGHIWVPIGTSTYQFKGVFDGDGHKIEGVSAITSSSYSGLFGYANGATIKNFTLEGASDSYSIYAGMVCGYATSCTISSVYATGAAGAHGNYAGGIVGYSTGSTISNCSFSGEGVGSYGSYSGGIVGYQNSGTIKNCRNYSTASGTSGYTGGIVGYVYTGTVSNCLVTGWATNDGSYVGGIAGFAGASSSGATISSCYTFGSVSGTTYIGGAVGCLNYGTVKTCAIEGEISGGSSTGGLLGYGAYTVTVQDCYFRGSLTSTADAKSLWGDIGTSTSYKKTFSNCFAIATINATGVTSSTSRGHTTSTNSYNIVYTNCYVVESVVWTDTSAQTKYILDNADDLSFEDFFYDLRLNEGYPMPRSLSSVGQFYGEMDSYTYLVDTLGFEVV